MNQKRIEKKVKEAIDKGIQTKSEIIEYMTKSKLFNNVKRSVEHCLNSSIFNEADGRYSYSNELSNEVDNNFKLMCRIFQENNNRLTWNEMYDKFRAKHDPNFSPDALTWLIRKHCTEFIVIYNKTSIIHW